MDCFVVWFVSKYYAWIKCMSNAWKKNKDCDNEAIEGYEHLVHKATVDSMNLICNRYEDDDAKCNKLYEELPKKKPKDMRPTAITYIFDIFEYRFNVYLASDWHSIVARMQRQVGYSGQT